MDLSESSLSDDEMEMPPRSTSVILESGSSEKYVHDMDMPSCSTSVNLLLKSRFSEKNAHSLSESDSSEDENLNTPQSLQYSDEGIIPTKKFKAGHSKSNIGRAAQKKKDDPMKSELKEWKQKLKSIKPDQALKNVTVTVTHGLLNHGVFSEAIKTLSENKIKYDVDLSEDDDDSVTWHWEEIPSEFCKKCHLALIWSPEKFIRFAQAGTLLVHFLDLTKKLPNHQVYLLLYGGNEFTSDKDIRHAMEHHLCELELKIGMSHWKCSSPTELAKFILHMTKSISQEPYRAEKEKLEQEKTFYLQGRSNKCVKIDQENNGMKRLWVQQINALHRLPLDSAKVICEHYPTPYCLYEAYNKLATVKEKQELLQDLLVGRQGVMKRLGPKMSGKIALLFGNGNGNLHLSDWK